MKLDKLYKMQEELDNHILEKHNLKMGKEQLLDNTILSLLVEVGELANTTRCFKHWSTKGSMEKEIILEELADVLHFYLSIGNQMGIQYNNDYINGMPAWININEGLTFKFLVLYSRCGELGNECRVEGVDLAETYNMIGDDILEITELLGLSNEEVEQAYLKKHEENYRRQAEGY